MHITAFYKYIPFFVFALLFHIECGSAECASEPQAGPLESGGKGFVYTRSHFLPPCLHKTQLYLYQASQLYLLRQVGGYEPII